mmetsp:Transcript_6157/g.11433  ORF Transcript_6157/g.11433 Transcript_6157/m.11433 type:complete len:307 (+) Transcript_6157:1270-2190(+)
MSCRNRKGGLDSSFSVSFGLLMSPANNDTVVSIWPSILLVSNSSLLDCLLSDEGSAEAASSLAAFSAAFACLRFSFSAAFCLARSFSLALFASASAAASASASALASALASAAAPLSASMSRPASAFCSGSFASVCFSPPFRGTLPGSVPSFAMAAAASKSILSSEQARPRAISSKFVFSGSAPATILLERTGIRDPLQIPANEMRVFKKAVLLSLSEILLESICSGENKCSTKPDTLLSAITTSKRNLKGGLLSSFSLILGFLMRAEITWVVSPITSSSSTIFPAPLCLFSYSVSSRHQCSSPMH